MTITPNQIRRIPAATREYYVSEVLAGRMTERQVLQILERSLKSCAIRKARPGGDPDGRGYHEGGGFSAPSAR